MDYLDKIIADEKVEQQWIEKFRALDIKKRKEIINKLIKKYWGDDYRNREYKLGYEPRVPLFGTLLDYGEMYGRELDTSDSYFPQTAFAIEEGFKVSATFGQGTFVDVVEYAEEEH